MPATQQLPETLIRENIQRAVSTVFKTMLGHSTRLMDTPPPVPKGVDGPPPVPQVVGMVGFLGDINGLIYLYMDQGFARMCTSSLLGMTETEVEESGDETVNDAIGELTNMTVGTFKNGLCDAGYPCILTIPSILRGSNFSIEPVSSANRFIFSFDCANHRVTADILLKTEA
jgi:chemotaxis protein CheX